MTQAAQIKDDCVLTQDSIYLHSKQDPKFIVLYFIIHILAISLAFESIWMLAINALLIAFIRNPFVSSFWYQLGYGEKYQSHWHKHLLLFRIFIVNGRVLTVLPRLSNQVAARLDEFRKLTND